MEGTLIIESESSEEWVDCYRLSCGDVVYVHENADEPFFCPWCGEPIKGWA